MKLTKRERAEIRRLAQKAFDGTADACDASHPFLAGWQLMGMRQVVETLGDARLCAQIKQLQDEMSDRGERKRQAAARTT